MLRDDHERAILTVPISVPLAGDAGKNPRASDSAPSRLVHDHPSGDPTPSRADIQMTQAIVEVAKPLGIAVHDHIIVGKDGHASLKGLRLI